MGYRLEWRLVGRVRQLLDSGTMDGDYPDRPSALDALDSLLVTFPLWGCNEAEGYWWVRRSSDADLEIQVSPRKQPLEGNVQPDLWTNLRRNQGASLRP
jgi:hypothetical protein